MRIHLESKENFKVAIAKVYIEDIKGKKYVKYYKRHIKKILYGPLAPVCSVVHSGISAIEY